MPWFAPAECLIPLKDLRPAIASACTARHIVLFGLAGLVGSNRAHACAPALHTHTHYSLVPHAQRTHSRAHSLPQENLGLEAPPGNEGRAVFEGTLACPVASIGLATLSTGPVVANAIGQAISATETRRCDLAQIGRTV